MQELLAVAVVIGTIAFFAAVAFINFRLENRPEVRFPSRNGTVAAVSIRRYGAAGETVKVDFTNLGTHPVMVGLSSRWQFWPDWSGAQQKTTVHSAARGRRYLPSAQETLGVIPANGTARLPIRVGFCLCRRVVAVVGEADGYLRVISMRIPRRPLPDSHLSGIAGVADPFTWLL